MSELSEYLELIKKEKDTKLLPKNIISGVSILGVPGNSDFTVKVDASVSSENGIQNYITEVKDLDLTNSSTISLVSFFSSCSNLEKASLKNGNNITSMRNLFYSCTKLEDIDFSNVDTTNVTDMYQMFFKCQKLTDIPEIDTSNVANMYRMFNQCESLKNIPVLNTGKVTDWKEAFSYCQSLTNQSLNNILQMCINATSYTGTKTLAYLGFNSSWCPVSKIQGLSNYQAFLNAGWTIGY